MKSTAFLMMCLHISSLYVSLTAATGTGNSLPFVYALAFPVISSSEAGRPHAVTSGGDCRTSATYHGGYGSTGETEVT